VFGRGGWFGRLRVETGAGQEATNRTNRNERFLREFITNDNPWGAFSTAKTAIPCSPASRNWSTLDSMTQSLPRPEVIITHESDLDGLIAGVLLQRLARKLFNTEVRLEACNYNYWRQRELRERSVGSPT